MLARGGGRSMGEIASHTALPAPTATRVVDKLVDSGLASRRTDPVDRRRVLVHLAGNGRAVIERVCGRVERKIGAGAGLRAHPRTSAARRAPGSPGPPSVRFRLTFPDPETPRPPQLSPHGTRPHGTALVDTPPRERSGSTCRHVGRRQTVSSHSRPRGPRSARACAIRGRSSRSPGGRRQEVRRRHAVGGAVQHRHRVARRDRGRLLHGEVGPGAPGGEEPFDQVGHVEEAGEHPARRPGPRHPQHGVADLPALPDHRVRAVDARQREVLPHVARLDEPLAARRSRSRGPRRRRRRRPAPGHRGSSCRRWCRPRPRRPRAAPGRSPGACRCRTGRS